MMTMKRVFIFLALFIALMINASSQVRRLGNTGLNQNNNVENEVDLSQDTIPATVSVLRHDTIVIEEIIRRTDVIHRTEEVIRREEKVAGSSNSQLYSPATNENHNVAQSSGANSVQATQTNNSTTAETTQSDNGLHLSFTPIEGGNYIWIPDSLESDVRAIISGKRRYTTYASRKNEKDFDPNEMVTFRGKSIPMVLKSRNLGRYDRGLFNYLYIPKGIWQIGLTASYGEFSTSDLDILDLVSDIDFYGHIFSIRPSFSYFFKNNTSIGLRLGYTNGKAAVESFNVDIDDDMNFSLHDIMYSSRNYSAAITLTQFLGITRKGRFGVFNEVELAFDGGTSDFNRPYDGKLRKKHTNMYQVALNFSPGLSVFILENLSFNVSFGVFGLHLKHEKQKVDGVYLGERTTSGANFRFNIFNINFGIAINI